jgi:hypothetical protein
MTSAKRYHHSSDFLQLSLNFSSVISEISTSDTASPQSLPPVAATRSRGRPYEGWTLKELIGEVRRLRRAASSVPPRPAGVLDLDGAPNQGDARASDTVALSPPSPCESQEQPHHLGKVLSPHPLIHVLFQAQTPHPF